MEFGKNIRQYRKERGLTQEKLAELSNLSADFISRVEVGKVKNISIQKLDNIARTLNVPVTSLIDYKPQGMLDDSETPTQVKVLIQQLNALDPDKANQLARYFSNIISMKLRD